jgi:NAD(P)-dependent dehydrogenase (short-subunit alcohol dehydrogenase family)
MTSTYSRPVLLVLGAGPGLGMSVARRFGANGYTVALVSRSATRHPDYLTALADSGVEASAFTADATDPVALRAAVGAVRDRYGRIDVGYFGPASADSIPVDITELDAAGAGSALQSVITAVDFASLLIPELRERGGGGLLFAGGLSSIVPMPPLGGLTLMAAALRNYALTLHAALAPIGVYTGTITIGGLIDRSDIHRSMQANAEQFGGLSAGTLDPDDLAETLWKLFSTRTDAEAVVTPAG